MNKRPVVIKVGGSLLARKQLKEELTTFLEGLSTHRLVLLTGGGPAVKAFRKHCEKKDTSEEQAHWRCVKMMADLTRTLCETFANSLAVSSWVEAERAWDADRIPWFIVESFLRADDRNADHLPHSWDVSSDSIAARLATQHGAELILLKACPLPTRRTTAKTLAKKGIVDAWFPQAVVQHHGWCVKNLPGGTGEEIVFDLTEPEKPVRPRRKPRRAPRSRRAAPVAAKAARRRK